MIKEKYKQFLLYLQISGIRTITIKKRRAQLNKDDKNEL